MIIWNIYVMCVFNLQGGVYMDLLNAVKGINNVLWNYILIFFVVWNRNYIYCVSKICSSI